MARRRIRRRARKSTSKVLRKVTNMINRDEEVKLDLVVVPTGAPVAASNIANIFMIMPPVLQGTLQGQRVGTKINIREFEIKGYTYNGNILNGNTGRIVLFRDMQSNGVLPLNSDLFSDVTAGSVITSSFNINNSNRFRILMDKNIAYNNHGGATNQADLKYWSFRKRYKVGKEAVVKYNNATTGTFADVISGALYVAFVTDVAASQPLFFYTSSIKYVDA